MLIDLHCDLNVLVTEAVLHIFGRSTLFGKHGGVGVTKTVVIKLVKPKLCAGDMTDMLHDLSVVKYISDRVGVMYLGNMVELANTQELFDHPLHPYTEALMAAIPTTDVEEHRELRILEGDIPSPVNPPQGCKFHTRCAHCTEICKHAVPEWKEMAPGHFVACHHPLGGEE